MAENDIKGLPKAAIENIETVNRLRGEAMARRSRYERLVERLGSSVGRVSFIVVHILWFLAWAAFNTSLVPVLPVFDPYPFNLFGTLVSFEALVITALVLIKQNRMSLLSDRRAHVELQMTLLAEKEVTHLIRMMEKVMVKLGIEGDTDASMQELREHTAVEEIARAVREGIPD